MVFWNCRCDCGKIACVRSNHLMTGNTKSCGCWKAEELRQNPRGLKHGMARPGRVDSLYRRWQGILTRCRNKHSQFYHRYGGRGITVCQEWLDFTSFLDWSKSSGYKPDLEIDRRDNNLGYCPENCRWVTRSVNQNNRSSNVNLVINGERFTIALASRRFKIPISTIRNRLVSGRTPDQAISDKIYENKYGSYKRKITEKDVLAIRILSASGKTGQQISNKFGISSGHVFKIVNREKWRHVK